MKPKIVFAHFHEGNDPDHKVRGISVYATRALVLDLDSGIPLEEAWARCTSKDAPSRKKGREIALGRLKKKLNDDEWMVAVGNTPQLKAKAA